MNISVVILRHNKRRIYCQSRHTPEAEMSGRAAKLPADRQKQLAEFQDKFRDIYQFSDNNTSVNSLLNQSLTHPGYRGEGGLPMPNYQRLEWIGDRVITIIVSEHIFAAHPDLDEGGMTRIRESLEGNEVMRKIAVDRLQMKDYMRTGQGFDWHKFKGWCDLVEALVGAIYLDAKKRNQKWEPIVRQFMSRYWLDDQNRAVQFKSLSTN